MSGSRKGIGGRPAFRPTAALRREVEQNIAGGLSEDQCAIAIGVSTPTLRKHFAQEIAFGRPKAQAELLRLLWRAARKGKVAAIEKLMKRADLAEAHAAFDGHEERPQPARRFGKKEEAAIAATTAGEGTEWGDDLQAPTIGLN